MATLLTEGYMEHVQPVLALNDKLRKLVVLEKDINVPIIVAVGDQSHGKSSVIEALSGVLLPRGEGMKTRLPLLLHLRALPDGEEEYARISEGPKFPLAAVAEKIDSLTDDVVGKGVVDVKDEEIELTVYRHGQIDLDLIDLPGMTRAVKTGGLADIEERIVAMYERYMAPAEAVLLNVVDAHTDTGNSKALQMSLDLDAERKRTIVVLTKVDQFSDGFDRLAQRVKDDVDSFGLLENMFFCLRNRSQSESDQAMTLEGAASEEAAFFEKSALRKLRSGPARLGRSGLADRLAVIQRERVLETLPATRQSIERRLYDHRAELDALPVVLDGQAACAVDFGRRLDLCFCGLAKDRTGLSTGGGGPGADMVRLELSVGNVVGHRYVCNSGEWQLMGLWKGAPADLFVYVHRKGEGRPFACTIQGCSAAEEEKRPMEAQDVFSNAEEGATSMAGLLKYQLPAPDERKVVVYATPAAPASSALVPSCAFFANATDAFCAKVHAALGLGFFFGRSFFQHMASRFAQFRGHNGLPGTFPSHIGVEEARRLQQRLYPMADDFADAVEVEARMRTKEAARLAFSPFDELARLMCTTVDATIDDARRDLAGHITESKDCFDQVMLEHRYYSFIIKDIHRQIDAVRKTHDDHLGFLTQANLQRFSNDENGVLEDVVRLAAYWKAMRKEFSGEITKRVKLAFFSVKMEARLKEAISVASLANMDELQRMMGPSVSQRKKRAEMEARAANMTEALDACTEFTRM